MTGERYSVTSGPHGENPAMASYTVNQRALARACQLIDARQ